MDERVSIPYRQSTNFLYPIITASDVQVSIPYRQSTNLFISLYCSSHNWVSLPYRQSTNFIHRSIYRSPIICFNSLQVEYKQGLRFTAFPSSSEVSIPYRQSTNIREEVYQYIIESDVSIPYRQSTNQDDGRLGRTDSFGFNSLQVEYKLYLFEAFIVFIRCFNSLQVEYKRRQESRELFN